MDLSAKPLAKPRIKLRVLMCGLKKIALEMLAVSRTEVYL